MTAPQLDLFAAASPVLPPGMRYEREIILPEEEAALIGFIRMLPLKPFEFTGGFTGNRRVLSFGWRYDFNTHTLNEAEPIPDALRPALIAAARALGIAPNTLKQALVTEYAPGAGIGWHKDRPIFEDVIGVSLAAPCRFRLRRKMGGTWERMSFIAEPRSAYLISGVSRHDWEHSIPPLDELRYSLTFRSFRQQT